jgi:hypothetical protein
MPKFADMGHVALTRKNGPPTEAPLDTCKILRRPIWSWTYEAARDDAPRGLSTSIAKGRPHERDRHSLCKITAGDETIFQE